MNWTYNKVKKSLLDVEAEIRGSCLILVPLHGIENQDMIKTASKSGTKLG